MSAFAGFRTGLGLLLCVCCGCVSGPHHRDQNVQEAASAPSVGSVSSSSNSYKLTASFFLLPPKPVIELVIYVRPGVPFMIKAQDKAENRCEVSGTLWQLSQEKFQLKPRTLEMKYPGGSFGVPPGPDPYELELGKSEGCMFVAGIAFGGYSLLLTKE